MNIRPKTVRRLVFLGGILALIILLLGGVLLWHRYSKQKQLLADRETGVSAFQSGDYVAALDKLKTVVNKLPDDFDALFAYSVSRSKVEMSNNQHLKEARALYLHLLSMRPDDLPTQHKLLELYTAIGYNAEANDLADKVLAKNVNDVDSLRAKAIALTNQNKFPEALEVSLKLNEIAPNDLAGQLQTRDLLCVHVKRTPAAVLEHYQKLQQAHPDDPQFEFLLGFAYHYNSDLPNALKWLRQSAQREIKDAELVRWLSRAFDGLRLFDESQQLLERAASVSKDPAIIRVMVERLWQNNRYDQVIEHLKDLNPASPTSNADLLAFKAMSLLELKQRDDGQQIIDALKARKGDNSAAAWAMALNVKYDDKPDAREAIAKYESALVRDRDNGIIRYWIGEAYLRLGETELGLRNMEDSAKKMPSWVKPPLRIARTCIALNRTAEAMDYANRAMQCAPTYEPAIKTFVIAEFQDWMNSPDEKQIPTLLSDVKQIQDHSPNEPETLPLYVVLQNRSGNRDAAIATLRSALADDTKLDADVLSRLLSISRLEKLDLDAEILAKMSGKLASSPRVAFEVAIDMARSGKAKEGLDLLQKSSSDSTDWKLAICQYRDATNDLGAQASWIALGDSLPDDIAVQSSILKSKTASGERLFYERTIERVHKLTGDAGVLWRLHRAKFLLTSSDPAKDSAEAVGLLTDLVRLNPSDAEYRVLLAKGLLNLGTNKETTQNAIAHLKSAADLEPKSVSTMLTLAKLLQSQNNREEMKDYLTRAAKANPRDADQREEIAMMLAQVGSLDQAYELLSTVEAKLDAQGQLLLAELSRRQGKTDTAERLFKSLLSKDAIEAETIAAAADFYAASNRPTDAAAALAKLNDARFSKKLRSQVLASYYEAHGSFEEARKHFIAAAVEEPVDVESWRKLVSFDLRNDQFILALDDAEEANKAAPSDQGIQDLKTQAIAMKAATGAQGDLSPLIEVLSKDPRNAPQVEFLKASQDIRTSKLPLDQAIARLKPVADKYPAQFAPQLLLTQMYVAANRFNEAASVAERAMAALPNDPQPAQLTVGVYQKIGKWREMKRSAEKWRERTLERPLAADLAIADAQMKLGEFASAIAQVQPYLESAKANPDANAAVLRITALALIQSQKIADAAAMFEPLLGNSTARRIFIDLAGTSVTPVETAKAWLSKAASQVPVDAPLDQLQLAQANFAVCIRLNDVSSRQTAIDILTKVCEKPDAAIDAVMVFANIQTHALDFPAAEKLLRRALTIQPNLPDAQNNLAFLLTQNAGDLNEAKDLATKAITAQPENPIFLDTLARIQSKQGDRPAAIKSFEQAIRLAPDNLDVLVGLSSVLQAEGDKSKVSAMLTRIDQLVKQGLKPSPAGQIELDTLRQQVSRTSD